MIDAVCGHGAPLARRRNAGIQTSSGSETDAVAGAQVATIVAAEIVMVGAELSRSAVAPRQCAALVRLAAATTSAVSTMAQWY